MARTERAALRELAAAWGVETGYEAVDGSRRRASSDTLVAVLRALGAPIEEVGGAPDALAARRDERARTTVDPVTVSWDDRPTELRLQLPDFFDRADVELRLTAEDGAVSTWTGEALGWTRAGSTRRFTVRPPEELELGYHHATVSIGGLRAETFVVRAPRRAPALSAAVHHGWGVFAPTYALHGNVAGGMTGTFTDLDELARWARGHGATIVSTLPLLATFVDEPLDPSPYSPVSLRFWNELFVDLARVPEIADADIGWDEIRRAHAEPLIDWRAAGRSQRRSFQAGLRRLRERGGARADDFERFRATTPDLREYATFRAAVEELGPDRRGWPAGLRSGAIDGAAVDPARVELHEYAQWLAEEQIGALAASLHDRGQCLALDLPVGCNPAGFDGWRSPEAFVEGATVGAPPDEFFTRGQNWGFRPAHPFGRRARGYAELRAVLAHHLRHAGMLRIDHVMGLYRLWMIPDGLDAADGAYVREPVEELFAVHSLEAHRFRSAIVGENLGTVPREVDELLERHRWLGMFVAEFSLDAGADDVLVPPPTAVVASIGTHDTATFGAFWAGTDIDDRERLGAIDAGVAADERRGRDEVRAALVRRFGHDEGPHANGEPLEDEREAHEVLAGLLGAMGRSDAALVLVTLEDLWLERHPQNIPGVGGAEYPSWRRRTALTLAEIQAPDGIGELVDSLQAAREMTREAAC
jgi:4-alpha-glucanotransferase